MSLRTPAPGGVRAEPRLQVRFASQGLARASACRQGSSRAKEVAVV